MRDKMEKAVDAALTGLERPSYLDALRAEILETLEERLEALRRVGVIEEAALKKVLADFEKSAALARSAARGDKKKYLEQLARSLGLSPLGRRLAAIQSLARIAAIFGPISAGTVGIAGGNAAAALGALTPFAAVALGGLLYVRLISNESAGRVPGSRHSLACALALAVALGVFGIMLMGTIVLAKLQS